MMERITWNGWRNCYRLSNEEVELVVTGDVGPRVIRYGYVNEPNLFAEIPNQLGKSGEKRCMLRGGSRIWIAPEDRTVRTYAIDNAAVEVDWKRGSLSATAPVEPQTGLQKGMRIELARTGSKVKVVHTVRNASRKSQDLSVWIITMLAAGGTGITGFPPRGTHPKVLPPTNPLVMWAFTDFSDPRWRFTKQYLMLRQDRGRPDAQKVGHFNKQTWGAYLLGDTLFVKRYKADGNAAYPDFGCSFEMFTNGEVLELETLSPMVRLKPGATVEHTEMWSLHKDVEIRNWTDEELNAKVRPLV